MIAQSIPELTNYEYNELSYNSATALITGSFIYQICDLLDKCYISIKPTDTYDYTIADAVMQFQTMVNIPVTGILTTSVLQAMILYADRISDTIESDEETGNATIDNLIESPHYNSFFDEENYKTHRRNHKDIKIVFGNKSITKTVKDVFMRSVTVEVDTSGNPISEVYEFIAKDVTESDEISDIKKYTGSETMTSSSDIKYDFVFNTKQNNTSTSRNEGGGGASSVTGGSGYSGGGSGGGSR